MLSQTPERRLRDLVLAAEPQARFLADHVGRTPLSALLTGTGFSRLEDLRGAVVAFATKHQLETALAAIELDGVARRILLCTEDIVAQLPSVIQQSGAGTIITDRDNGWGGQQLGYDRSLPFRTGPVERTVDTEWVLFTSGTSGQPKMVVHTLPSLSGPLDDGLRVASGTVWSTFYDIRRYGGLTILLRALLGGGSMVLSGPASEPIDTFLRRTTASDVTHMSGTPSHWRKALMTPLEAGMRAPGYIRMSGEIADQAILDQLRQAFPGSDVAHAFASTEAGFAFDVRDGRAGFPASYLNNPAMKADLRIVKGTLHIRSGRTAAAYIGAALGDAEGFIDTGDLVEQRGDRCYFVGRVEGMINVGGRKVFPEEIEAVLVRHPAVSAAKVQGRRNPITGFLAAADLVLRPDAPALDDLRKDLAAFCAQHLESWRVPVSFRAVRTIPLNASGKIARHG